MQTPRAHCGGRGVDVCRARVSVGFPAVDHGQSRRQHRRHPPSLRVEAGAPRGDLRQALRPDERRAARFACRVPGGAGPAADFNDVSRTFLATLRDLLPALTEEELFWRFHFLLGAHYYTLSNPGRITIPSEGRVDPTDAERSLYYLVPF